MSGSKKLTTMKSKLTIYRLGLDKAVAKGNTTEISRWEDSIAALEQEIDELAAQ